MFQMQSPWEALLILQNAPGDPSPDPYINYNRAKSRAVPPNLWRAKPLHPNRDIFT